MNQSNALLALWAEGRTRFSQLLVPIQEADLRRKLADSPNSAGFLIRHIADVELLFAKNVFGAADVKVHAKTVIDKSDTGEWTNLEELLLYQNQSADTLKAIISQQSDEAWQQIIETKEFGTKSRAEALGRIVSHTAYHAGQLALVLKYGKVPL